MIEARDYQTKGIERVRSAIAQGAKSVILSAPCGSGKTACASIIMRGARDKGKRCIFFADAIELVEQTSDHISQLGIPYMSENGHAIIMDGFDYIPEAPIQIASLQTWRSWFEKRGKEKPRFDLAIIDECQISNAATYRAILGQFPIKLGLSATPATGKGEPLDGWDTLIQVASYRELIHQGYLVPAKCYAPTIPDTSELRKNPQSGDYAMNDDAVKLMSGKELVGNVYEYWKKLCQDRVSILFGCRLDHSIYLRDLFRARGVTAEHIDGKTPKDKRRNILERARAGDVQVLCNYRVFGRGVDLPIASAVINCRPFNSLVPYRQAMCRAGRPYKGKLDFLVIDHTASVLKFGYPDEDITWKLGSGNAHEALAEPWRVPGERTQTICPRCNAYREKGGACPECGYKYKPRGKAVMYIEGELRAVSRKRAKATVKGSPQRVWMSSLAIAAHRNQTAKAAFVHYKREMGSYPRDVTPMPDDSQMGVRVSVLYPSFVRGKK